MFAREGGMCTLNTAAMIMVIVPVIRKSHQYYKGATGLIVCSNRAAKWRTTIRIFQKVARLGRAGTAFYEG